MGSGLLPQDAQFSVQDAHILRWDTEPSATISRMQEDFFSGLIMVWPSAGKDIPDQFFYAMAQHTFIRNVEIVSPSEAFKEVEKGNFNQYNDMMAGKRF